MPSEQQSKQQSKQLFGFKAEADYVEFLDKLITLSQYGLTETNYKTRTDFMLDALSREMERFYEEVMDVPMLAPLAKALMETYGGEKFFYGKKVNANDNHAGNRG